MEDEKSNPNGQYIDTPENLKKKGDRIKEMARDNPVQRGIDSLASIFTDKKKENQKGLL